MKTVRLRLAAEPQLESVLRPMVVLVPTREQGVVALKNIGNGAALNIRIFSSHVPTVGGEDIMLRFPVGMVALGPGAVENMKVAVWANPSQPTLLFDVVPISCPFRSN
jgi:hypothetical protein